jgi:hypothetical protein
MLFDLGKVSADQEIAQLKTVENARFAALQRDLNEKLQFANQDAQAQGRVNLEIEQLKREHDNRMAAFDLQAAQKANQTWQSALQPIRTAFDGMLRGVLSGTQTFQQAMQNVAQNIVISYAEMGLKVALDWAGHQLAMAFASEINAAKALGEWVLTELGISTAADTTATDQGTAAGAAATAEVIAAGVKSVAQIHSAAMVAGANAYAFWAWNPPVAAGMAADAVMTTEAFSAGLVASAAGGYDIPAGVNPVTQLHAEEMVLPAGLANAVRGMAANGNSGAGGGHTFNTTVNVNRPGATDDEIANAVGRAMRNFHPALRRA